MSDLHATERIIGGLIVVGIASLLNWNHAQGGEPGVFGTVLVGVMVLGGLWAILGLFELFTSGSDLRDTPMGQSSETSAPPT